VNTHNIFKPDRNQLIAVIAMIAAVFLFGVGEIVFGFILFAVAAAFSLGGLFWNAHRQDQAEAAEYKKAKDAAASGQGNDSRQGLT
jgi:hypothetical protein